MERRSSPANARPVLLVLAGLPGVGKSTLARELMLRRDAVWLRVDTIEAALLKAGIPRSFATGLAAYLAACDLGRENLRLRHDLIVDAVNGVEPAREMWRSLAVECDAERYVVEVICTDPREHRRRVESRLEPTPPLPPLTWEEVVDREYIPWTEPHLTVDGCDPPAENIARILDHILSGKEASGVRPLDPGITSLPRDRGCRPGPRSP